MNLPNIVLFTHIDSWCGVLLAVSCTGAAVLCYISQRVTHPSLALMMKRDAKPNINQPLPPVHVKDRSLQRLVMSNTLGTPHRDSV